MGPIVIHGKPGTLEEQRALRDRSELYSLNPDQDAEAKALIDQMRSAGNTLGGVIEVRVEGVPFGLGTHTQWDLKLDGRLSQAIMATQAIKGRGDRLGIRHGAAAGLGSARSDTLRSETSPARPPWALPGPRTTPADWRRA